MMTPGQIAPRGNELCPSFADSDHQRRFRRSGWLEGARAMDTRINLLTGLIAFIVLWRLALHTFQQLKASMSMLLQIKSMTQNPCAEIESSRRFYFSLTAAA